MPKPKERKFRVFEFGSGRNPRLLEKHARKSSKKALHREFKGVEVQGFAETKRLRELSKALGNVRFVRGDGLKQLERERDNSLDIVFDAYASQYLKGTANKKFFELAAKKLKPGGRLVLIQDRVRGAEVKQIASENGLAMLSERTIPDGKAKKSGSVGVRLRSSHAKRAGLLEDYFREMTGKENPTREEAASAGATVEFMASLFPGRYGTTEDILKPMIYVFKKPAELFAWR